ncbi:MAG: amino acid carrier protein [Clostridia bacterium]
MEIFLQKVESLVWSFPLVIVLMTTHIFFTFYLKCPQKYTKKGFEIIFKKNKIVKEKKGISSFSSLMTILAATLGVGNIIGVASAITIGGIGSIFWIFVSGVFAIATKYAETYLVLKYRKKDKNGYYGGAMYVLKEKLGFRKLAILFSIFVVLAAFGGSMIQSNSMVQTMSKTFNINIEILAIITTIFCAYVIFGNEKRIARVSSVLVPISCIVYGFMCIALAYLFRYNLVNSIVLIVKDAINFRAVAGGIFASLAIKAMNVGLSKGLFSNEAGMGSSPIFNATVEGDNTKNESIVASTSVFIDTVILCVITGVLMVASGVWRAEKNPISLTIIVFGMIKNGNFFLTFCIGIFAIATIPCLGYYLSIAIKFLSNSNNNIKIFFEIVYIFCIYIGCVMSTKSVWAIASIANAFMVIPNLIMVYKLRSKIKK